MEDYTGRLIQDTYETVLHRGADGQIYDGIGSIYQVSSSISSSYITWDQIDNVPNIILESNTSSLSVLSASYALTASVAYSASSVAWNDVYGSPNFIESFETSSMVVLSSSYAARSAYFYTTITATGSYTASMNNFVLCDTTSGSFSVLLPNSPNDSQIGIKKIKTANSVTIYTEGSEEVDENDTPLIITRKASATLICNSNNWYII